MADDVDVEDEPEEDEPNGVIRERSEAMTNALRVRYLGPPAQAPTARGLA